MASLIQKVNIFLHADDFSAFWALLSYGFKLDVQIGSSLFDLLVRQVDIKESYLNEKVQTVFLNGNVVDDFSVEIVKNGSVIALSAAMPGLVGAVFRKGGILAAMRSEQTPHVESGDISMQNGQVSLKFFNLVAADLGGDFFKKGICVKGKHFIRYVKSKQSVLKMVCRQLIVDGRQYETGNLLSLLQPEADIFLTINSA